MNELIDMPIANDPHILVIGIGGGGNNAINRMKAPAFDNVSYAVMNTDIHVLEQSTISNKLQLGQKLTSGFGAGGDPEVGQASATESEKMIAELVVDADMVILTCGMGGGTGTGAIPVVAKQCKDAGILTIAVVTLPFSFEGTPKTKIAQAGIEKLTESVDTLLIIPNDKLLSITEKPFYLEDAFQLADTVLNSTIRGLTSIIYHTGLVNLDFNDIKKILTNKGLSHLGIGTTDADGSIIDAVKDAINSPLLETDITHAETVMINTSGRIDINALNEAIAYIKELAGTDVNIPWGTVPTEQEDQITITLIATGLRTQIEEETKVSLQLDSQLPLSSADSPSHAHSANQDGEIVIPHFLRRNH